MISPSFRERARQAWTIAAIELRRAFFARRSLWVYALALLPTVMFAGHAIETRIRSEHLNNRSVTPAPLLDSLRDGESADAVKTRLGKPAEERWSTRSRRVRQQTGTSGITTHRIDPAARARFVRLNITRPTTDRDDTARIYEFEVYGPGGPANLALGRPATGSVPCSEDRGPDKAVNGSVTGGPPDSWCAEDWPLYLQVDLGSPLPVSRVVVKHASAGGEDAESDTRDFNLQVSTDGKVFTTVETASGVGFVDERTEYRQMTFFDGRRVAHLTFVDGKLESRDLRDLLNFEGDRTVFSAIFQYFYLRLAVFFGSLGIFIYLFRGEMTDRTLHYWLLAPARREVLLAGKYLAGLIASATIFGGAALLAFGAMVWPHDAVQVDAYWRAGGLGHAFWYTMAAVFGCVGYGSVFLALGLYVRNPIVPAAVVLAWESVNGVLPHVLQKLSILHYLQSLCPIPAPIEDDVPALMRLLAAPAAPASRPGAVLGLLLLTGIVLWLAARAVRRMQISYGSEG